MRSLNLTAAIVAASLLGATLATCLPPGAVLASRNSSGTYSLPTGNPVVTGTTISSTWANTTLSDLGTEVTNSLDRNGRGAMLAPLQCYSGTVTAPGVTWASEPGSGLYRAGTHDVRMSINQADVAKWTTSGVTVTGSGSFSNGLTVTGNETVTASAADGVDATGGASFIGLNGTGGNATSGNAGSGVTGTGGNGTAGNANGGAGVRGFGGTQNGAGAPGIGVAGQGATGAVGGYFTTTTAATASVPQESLQAACGYFTMDGVANPNSTVGFKNRLTPKNIAKAWGSVTSNGSGGASVNDGFNIASVSGGTSCFTVTLATGMASSVYAVVGGGGCSGACIASPTNATTLSVCPGASVATNICTCTFAVFGAQ